MLKKQNIIFLGGRRPNETASTKANPFKLTRNASNSATKTSFLNEKSNLPAGRLQPKPDLQKPTVLGDRTNSMDEPGHPVSVVRDKAAESNSRVFEKLKQKESAQSTQESIIQRIQQQKKEFIERQKQRQHQRQRYFQQLHHQQHQQQLIQSGNNRKEPQQIQSRRQDARERPGSALQVIETSKPSTFSRAETIRVVRGFGLVGLNNIGNTCFMNATLQCLFNIPNFNEYFIGGQYLKELQPNGRVAEQYAKLASNVCGESSNKNQTPSELKQALGSRQSQFLGYSQQDAQELLVNLLECMGEDLSRVDKKSAPYRQLAADISRQSVTQIVQKLINIERGVVVVQQTA